MAMRSCWNGRTCPVQRVRPAACWSIPPAHAYTGIARRLGELEPRHVDRLVLGAHIDADHIEGMILAVNDRDLGLEISEVWYNGYPQLSKELAAPHGEILGALISERGLDWNEDFRRGAVKATTSGESLTTVRLPGDLIITVLAPAQSDLRALHDYWLAACEEAGRRWINRGTLKLLHEKLIRTRGTGIWASNRSTSNGSHVTVAARIRPSLTAAALSCSPSTETVGCCSPATRRPALHGLSDPPRSARNRAIELSDFKVPHHGSANNITREIIEMAPAERYLFSSTGSHFNHPDDSAVATVLRYGRRGAELVFNYSNPRTRQWGIESLREQYRHTTRYPEPGMSGIRL